MKGIMAYGNYPGVAEQSQATPVAEWARLSSVAAGAVRRVFVSMFRFDPFTIIKTLVTRFALGFLGIILCCQTSSLSASLDTIQIDGVICATSYRNADILGRMTNWFTVVIDDTNAQIRMGPMGDPAIDRFEYGELEFGSYTTIFYTTNYQYNEGFIFKDGKLTKEKTKKPIKSLNEASVLINGDKVPEYTLGMISPVWLAYASHKFFNAETNHIFITPIFSVGNEFRETGGVAILEYSLNQNPPKFLRSAVEYFDRSHGKQSGWGRARDAAFTNAVYKVSGYTNISGVQIPKDFIISNFFINDSAYTLYEGVATNVVISDSKVTGFKIPNITRVTDKRHELVNPLVRFSYTTTNGLLLNRAKIEDNNNFITEKMEMSKAPPRILSAELARRHGAVFVILFIITAVPIYFLIKSIYGKAPK